MWYVVSCCEWIADATCSVLIYSTLLWSILFPSIVFYSILFCFVLLYSILFYSTLLCSDLLSPIPFYFILFSSLLFCPVLPDSFLFCILFWSVERSGVIPNKYTIVKTQSRAIKNKTNLKLRAWKQLGTDSQSEIFKCFIQTPDLGCGVQYQLS